MTRVYSVLEREVPRRYRPGNVPGITGGILNAAGERVHQSGFLELEDPFGGSKTISAAGGGSIVWLVSTSLTWADVSTNLRIGLQDWSGATNPLQGDGTWDVYADLIPGTDTVTVSAINEHAMDTGTKTMSQGDPFTFAVDMTARAGADTVRVGTAANFRDVNSNIPMVATDLTGTFARSLSTPVMQIVFDDGTTGWLKGAPLIESHSITSPHVNTTVADEYGNAITLTAGGYLTGFAFSPGYPNSATGDLELILYSDPFGTPVAEHVVSVSYKDMGTVFAGGEFKVQLGVPQWLAAGTYGVTVRPITTGAVTLSYYSSDTALHLDQYGGVDAYAIRRLDNTGAFTDFNGGTAKTRRMEICALIAGGDFATGRAATHIGI